MHDKLQNSNISKYKQINNHEQIDKNPELARINILKKGKIPESKVESSN